MKKSILLFSIICVVFAAVFTSCGTDDSVNGQTTLCTTQKYLRSAVDQELLTVDEFKEADRNIAAYEERGFCSKYAFYAIFVAYMVGTIVYAWKKDDVDQPEPASVWKTYLFWLLGGMWTAHLFHLTGYTKNFWWRLLSIIIVLALFTVNYNALMYYWRTPDMLLFYFDTWDIELANSYYLYVSFFVFLFMFFVNIIIPLIFIPYWVYKYNNRTFYKVPEHHSILKGYMMLAEEDYKKQKDAIVEVDSLLQDIDKEADRVYHEHDFDRLSVFSSYCERVEQSCEDLFDSVDYLENAFYRTKIGVARNLFIMNDLISNMLKDHGSDIVNESMITEIDTLRSRLIENFDKLENQIKNQTWNGKVLRRAERALESVSLMFEYDRVTRPDRVERAFIDALNDVGECVSCMRNYKEYVNRRWLFTTALCSQEKSFVMNFEIFRKDLYGKASLGLFIQRRILGKRPNITCNEFNFHLKKLIEIIEVYKKMEGELQSLINDAIVPMQSAGSKKKR